MAKPDIQYIQYYTAGSAARQLAPVRNEQEQAAHRTRKKKQPVLYIDPIAILGCVTAIILVVCLCVAFGNLRQAQQQRYEMENYENHLEAENARLTQVYADSYDLEEVRLEAILMGYVQESQVAHITVTAPTPAPQAQEVSWFEAVVNSVVELFA